MIRRLKAASASSNFDFGFGRSLRCQAVVRQTHGVHRLATVATPTRPYRLAHA